MAGRGAESWFSIFCPLQGTYALGTWWLSNRMYFQVPTGGNSVFGPFVTSFVVILGHSEPGSLGRWVGWLVGVRNLIFDRVHAIG